MNRTKLSIIFSLLLLLIPSRICSQQDPVRVACVGNSITEGIAMPTASLDSYPADLGRYLGDDYNVRNFGKSGRTMLKKGDFPLWNEQVFKDAINFDPDILIILLGTNDTKPQNWIYKDEFLTDYYSMIDTFQQGHSNPQIYVCYPLSSFSDAFDIRDSIIVADIIPMISQIVDSLNLKLIDFNTPFLDKSYLMPDGIHPLVEGSDLMARIIYEKLTGKTIELLKENNVAFNKKAFQLNNELPRLIDQDTETSVSFNSASTSVIINLLDQYEIDMVQIHFPISPSNVSFSISTSIDSLEWITVVDTSLTNEINAQNSVVKFVTTQAHFIKFEILGIEQDSTLVINEIKVFENRPVHSPLLTRELISSSSTSNRMRIYFDRTSKCGEYLKIYRQLADTLPYSLYSNYRSTDPFEFIIVLPFETLNRFYSVAYFDGVEIQSDTLTIISTPPTKAENYREGSIPSNYTLMQNYPNPFNPETIIEFEIPNTEVVSIEIFDAAGRLVRTLGNYVFSYGDHQVRWDGRNLNGIYLASGVYYYRLKAANKFTKVRKMTLLR